MTLVISMGYERCVVKKSCAVVTVFLKLKNPGVAIKCEKDEPLPTGEIVTLGDG